MSLGCALKVLNLGCGRRFSTDHVNIDFQPSGPSVLACDLAEGLHFADESFDVVYHSHVLEHFDLKGGRALLKECFRVLRPGGTLRISVPDLEQIARAYLDALDRARSGQEAAQADHRWMLLEMFDQTVRNQSGGEMKKFLLSDCLISRDFVLARLGAEAAGIFESGQSSRNPSWKARLKAHGCAGLFKAASVRIALQILKGLASATLGKRGRLSLTEGWFRTSGEISPTDV